MTRPHGGGGVRGQGVAPRRRTFMAPRQRERVVVRRRCHVHRQHGALAMRGQVVTGWPARLPPRRRPRPGSRTRRGDDTGAQLPPPPGPLGTVQGGCPTRWTRASSSSGLPHSNCAGRYRRSGWFGSAVTLRATRESPYTTATAGFCTAVTPITTTGNWTRRHSHTRARHRTDPVRNPPRPTTGHAGPIAGTHPYPRRRGFPLLRPRSLGAGPLPVIPIRGPARAGLRR
jgi:hypothetical protein